jgi:nicotinate-nucleotide pyrophosphorylase (carboxylating)
MNISLLPGVSNIVAQALAEDIGRGDVTTDACISADTLVTAHIVSRADGVIAGISVVKEVFRQIDEQIQVTPKIADGTAVPPNKEVVIIKGPARGILTGERVALNFIGRLSGIATITSRCVAATKGTKANIVDTRKTTPGLRILEKYAVRMGGGRNHRIGLDDGILIKDNHIVASGGITNAITNARNYAHHLLSIEVECESLEQVREALSAHVHAILLDNMSISLLKDAVSLIRASAPNTIIEASGNVGTDPAKIRAVAETGIDLISIGALTHSAPVLDLSLEFLTTITGGRFTAILAILLQQSFQLFDSLA